jgi:hypothetical protein
MFTVIGKNEIRNAVRMPGPEADAEPHHEDRHDRRLGHRVEGDHQRVDRRVGQPAAADQEAQHHADDDADAEAQHRDPERLPGRFQQRRLEFDELQGDLPGARERCTRGC